MESKTMDTPDHCVVRYTPDEKAELLQFLLQHKAETGDGKNFIGKTFTAAATHLSRMFPNVKPA